MTTIVYHHEDGELASESQATSGDTIMPMGYTKIHRLSYGWAGFCGSSADVPALLRVLDGEKVDGNLAELNVGCIVLPDVGRAYNIYIDSLGGIVKEYLTSSWACGSGRDFALGALAVGSSARDAVKAAIKYDLYSGGKVVVKKRGQQK